MTERSERSLGRIVAIAGAVIVASTIASLVIGTWLLKSRADELVRERAMSAQHEIERHVQDLAEMTRLQAENLAQSPVFRASLTTDIDRDTIEDAVNQLIKDRSVDMFRVSTLDGRVLAVEAPGKLWQADGAGAVGWTTQLVERRPHIIATIAVELRPNYVVHLSLGRVYEAPVEHGTSPKTWWFLSPELGVFPASEEVAALAAAAPCSEVGGLEGVFDSSAIVCSTLRVDGSSWIVQIDPRKEWLHLATVLAGSGAVILVGLLAALWILRLVVRRDRELIRAKNAAETAGRAKAEFLAMMSHEIRTPMNAVIGMAELLQRTAVDERQTRYLATLRTSAMSLLSLINDILDLSKIESGKLELRQSEIDVRELIEEVCTSQATFAQSKGLELVCDVPASLTTTVHSDPDRLRQIMTNLVGNAVKFTDKGEIAVRARGQVEGDRVTLQIEVCDTGVGISQGDQARLFEPFYQADSSYSRKQGGTGLGLAIASRLVALIGSDLRVTSAPGRGTRFFFSFTADKANSPRRSRRATGRVKKLRVLVVDDNETNRLIVSEQLLTWGMECTTTESGPKALEAWQQARDLGHPYDVALLDGHMADMDGLEVARRLRLLDGPLKLVMMTSIDGGDDKMRSRVDDWLTKPVRQSELFDCLSRLHADEPIVRAVTSSPLDMSHQGARVLLVEDNEVNQAVATELLREFGVTPKVVSNGAEAVDAVKCESFDIVLMDCQMPIMDGYEATERIRHLEGNGRRTIIVALTAHAMAGDREVALSRGMDDYLTKPVTVEALSAVLRRWHEGQPVKDLVEKLVVQAALPDVIVQPAPAARSELLNPRTLRKPKFIELFLRLAPKDLVAIRDAPDGDELQKGAHRLKGSAFALGLPRLAHTCHEVEQLAKAQGSDAVTVARVMVVKLQSDFDATCRALEAELASAKPEAQS